MFSDTMVSMPNPQTRDFAFIFCIASCIDESNPWAEERRSEEWWGALGKLGLAENSPWLATVFD